MSSHIRRRLSERCAAITCVCVTLIYSLSAGSRPFIWANLAGLHPGLKPHCSCDVNLQMMERFKSPSLQQLADRSSTNFSSSLQGLPQWFSSRHVTLSSESSSFASAYFMSSLTTSVNLLFGPAGGLLTDSSNLGIQFALVCHFLALLRIYLKKPSAPLYCHDIITLLDIFKSCCLFFYFILFF